MRAVAVGVRGRGIASYKALAIDDARGRSAAVSIEVIVHTDTAIHDSYAYSGSVPAL